MSCLCFLRSTKLLSHLNFKCIRLQLPVLSVSFYLLHSFENSLFRPLHVCGCPSYFYHIFSVISRRKNYVDIIIIHQLFNVLATLPNDRTVKVVRDVDIDGDGDEVEKSLFCSLTVLFLTGYADDVTRSHDIRIDVTIQLTIVVVVFFCKRYCRYKNYLWNPAKPETDRSDLLKHTGESPKQLLNY